MPRRGENITKRADGRWEARYIKGRAENGKALYGFVYARTYTEVKEKRKQRINAETEPPKNIDDISKIINAFLMSKKTEVKESTYAHYRQLINNHILTYWNGKRIRDITSPMLEDYKLFLINSGGNKKNGLSKKTVKEVLGLLHQIFKYSEMHGLSNNPFKDFKMPKTTKPEIKILSRVDQKILEQEIKDSSDKLFGIYLCLYTGLRLGEICALRWEDIDFSSGILSVKRSMQRISLSADGSTVKTKIRIDTPKTESSYRDIPLSSTLLHMLEERKAKITDTRSYFLTGSDNYVEPRNYYKFYKRQEKECGIGDYTFHALRHTFATRCIAFSEEESKEIYKRTYAFLIDYLEKVLLGYNVTIRSQIDDVFDPKIHKVLKMVKISQEEIEKDKKISKVISDCYMLGDKVVSPAKVVLYRL